VQDAPGFAEENLAEASTERKSNGLTLKGVDYDRFRATKITAEPTKGRFLFCIKYEVFTIHFSYF
jgi:hypothetical protein